MPVEVLEAVLLYLYFLRFMEVANDEFDRLGRRWWVKPYNQEQRRELHGALNETFLYFKFNDTEEFYRFTRMTPPQFEVLLELVSPNLEKHSMRTPLSPEMRLAIVLQ